jgi:hypothetical protein
VCLGQVNSSYVNLFQVKSCSDYIRTGEFKSCYKRIGQVRSGYFMICEVISC